MCGKFLDWVEEGKLTLRVASTILWTGILGKEKEKVGLARASLAFSFTTFPMDHSSETSIEGSGCHPQQVSLDGSSPTISKDHPSCPVLSPESTSQRKLEPAASGSSLPSPLEYSHLSAFHPKSFLPSLREPFPFLCLGVSTSRNSPELLSVGSCVWDSHLQATNSFSACCGSASLITQATAVNFSP